jgi:diadenosine tetraphosphatase ApaH/serine/threonine PP2A family protein phosphatase
MKTALFADVHSNFEALQACLAHAARRGAARSVFLGDLVGYGADPNETIRLLRRLKPLDSIRGNHDKVCSGLEDGRLFNPIAQAAAQWTSTRLTAANLRFLKALPEGPRVVDNAFAISHGTPIDEDAYIFGEIEALNVFRKTEFDVCFFGHSHFPVVFALSPDSVTTLIATGPTFRLRLRNDVRYLINPGSVGQPRDGNPSASFALYDAASRVVTIHRVRYAFKRTQAKIYKAGLPRPLGDRLALGR